MKTISRRSFARNTVVIATAAAMLPSDLFAEETTTAPPNAEVEARIQWIFTKYGARLNDAQRADIRRLIASGQASIDAMRAYALDNADDPATPFRIQRGGSAK
jgi:hypothetical protein